MKILSLFGTRPEIIRLSRIFSLLDKNFEHVMVNTNQNYTQELNPIFFEQLKIRKPDYDLKIRTDAYGKEVAEIISKSETLLKKEAPDILLILGDTNSGLAAIPAAHQNIKMDVSDDIRLVKEMGIECKVVEGSEQNFKITTQQDFQLAEILLKENG